MNENPYGCFKLVICLMGSSQLSLAAIGFGRHPVFYFSLVLKHLGSRCLQRQKVGSKAYAGTRTKIHLSSILYRVHGNYEHQEQCSFFFQNIWNIYSDQNQIVQIYCSLSCWEQSSGWDHLLSSVGNIFCKSTSHTWWIVFKYFTCQTMLHILLK